MPINSINNTNVSKKNRNRITIAGMLITLGVVYGDIGTSPLYVMKAIIEGNGGIEHVDEDFLIGSISLIFWTLMLITTIKYVCIALRADNKGEGGIFALYTLIRKRAKWLIIPAMIGGAALLADGMLTPAVTVTSAIEGLRGVLIGNKVVINNQTQVIIITMIILSCLFMIQRYGTELIGRAFGPIMLVWFTFLGIIGLIFLCGDLTVLRAINPYYAIKLLFSPENKMGLLILGNVFLATTGAEALYSDIGHVGRGNIYASWPYVNICLLLNYCGQAVWIERNQSSGYFQHLSDFNPFYDMMPSWLRLFGVAIATLAAIIASQALISGSYTLVAEAIRLRLLPRLRIIYPTNFKGQLYMPVVNNILWIVCMLIVFFFRTSEHMEAAYGLAITVTMLMTTLLLYQYLRFKKVNIILSWLMLIFFGTIETLFFIASVAKFMHGGFVTAFIAIALLAIMFIWQYGDYIKNDNSYRTKDVSLLAYKKQLNELSNDDSYPLYATNLVYMTRVKENNKIKKNILYSILDKRPKRAKVYWFVTVNVTDEPYTAAYTTDMYGTDYMVNVQLYLGFRVSQRVNIFLRQIINDMMKSGELPRQPQKYTTIPDREVGDFSFVILQEELSPSTQINGFEKAIIQARLFLQKITITPATWFGLEYSDVIEEHVPLVLGKVPIRRLSVIKQENENDINHLKSEVDDDDI